MPVGFSLLVTIKIIPTNTAQSGSKCSLHCAQRWRLNQLRKHYETVAFESRKQIVGLQLAV
jgi:hypothetical protein